MLKPMQLEQQVQDPKADLVLVRALQISNGLVQRPAERWKYPGSNE
jgi:hypothetical protein